MDLHELDQQLKEKEERKVGKVVDLVPKIRIRTIAETPSLSHLVLPFERPDAHLGAVEDC